MQELFFKQTGNKDGETIIFLHAIGTSGWMWEDFAEQLPGYNNVIPDLPGHGKSAGIAWTSLENAARGIRDIIARHSRSGTAHLVGLSFGSYIALELMSRYPEVVDSALLSGLNVLPIPGKWRLNLIGTLLRPFMKMDFLIRSNANMLHIPEDQYSVYKKAWLEMDPHAFRKISKEVADFCMPGNIASICCRTLLIAGAKEHRLIQQSNKELQAIMPHAKGFIVNGVGHGWSGEDPELFLATIRAWIAEQPLMEKLIRVYPPNH